MKAATYRDLYVGQIVKIDTTAAGSRERFAGRALVVSVSRKDRASTGYEVEMLDDRSRRIAISSGDVLGVERTTLDAILDELQPAAVRGLRFEDTDAAVELAGGTARLLLEDGTVTVYTFTAAPARLLESSATFRHAAMMPDLVAAYVAAAIREAELA